MGILFVNGIVQVFSVEPAIFVQIIQRVLQSKLLIFMVNKVMNYILHAISEQFVHS